MDLKKEFCQRKIKQETESEPYSSISETFTASTNLLEIKFEDTSYSSNEHEDQIENRLAALVNGDHVEEPNQLTECKTLKLTKNLDVELISDRQVCRLCAQTITSTEIFLYEDDDLEQKINYTLPITLELGDGLPEYICQNCEINLNLFYDFVCQVVNADKVIRGGINPPDVKRNDVAVDAVIKQIFGAEEELEKTNESSLQDNQLLEKTTNESNQLLEVETNENCTQNTQLFEAEINEHLQGAQSLEEEPESKLVPDLKIPIIRMNDRKPAKHLILDGTFTPQKIRKISILDPSVQQKTKLSFDEYMCEFCNESFSDYYSLTEHSKDLHERNRFSCPEIDCSEIFGTQKSLRQHIINIHNTPVICHKCGKIFAHQEALGKHQENIHSEKVCNSCGMPFRSGLGFQSHKLLHAEVSEYQCVYCYKNFKNRHTLHRHTRQTHSGNYTLLVNVKEDEFKKTGSSR